MKYLTNIDLVQNELQNAVVQPLAVAPAGTLGQIYYNSTEKVLYQHDGTQWVAVGVLYTMGLGTQSANTVPLKLVGNDGTTNTVTLAGTGGITLTASGDTLTISGTNTDTTYTFTGVASSSNYVITITPSVGTAQTITLSLADASNAGLMSPAQYTKLSGIEAGAQVNQNAFGKVKVGATEIDADSAIDTLELIAGSNVTITPDASNDSVSFAATDTTYNTVTQAELEAGTSTSNRVITPKVIHDYVAAIAGGADAMRYKGTIGTGGTVSTLPNTHEVGDTYMVITAGTYAGQTCEVGDLLIALGTTGTSSSDWTAVQTNIDGAITSITGTSPISVTGSGASRTVSHDNSGVSAGSYGDSSNQTPAFGGTFKALYQTVNATGHTTGLSEHTVTIPNTTATTSNPGLMSVAQVNKLDNTTIYIATTIMDAGTTSASLAGEVGSEIISKFAYDATTFQEVAIDWEYVSPDEWVGSIAQAYSEDIVLVGYYIKAAIVPI